MTICFWSSLVGFWFYLVCCFISKAISKEFRKSKFNPENKVVCLVRGFYTPAFNVPELIIINCPNQCSRMEFLSASAPNSRCPFEVVRAGPHLSWFALSLTCAYIRDSFFISQNYWVQRSRLFLKVAFFFT